MKKVIILLSITLFLFVGLLAFQRFGAFGRKLGDCAIGIKVMKRVVSYYLEDNSGTLPIGIEQLIDKGYLVRGKKDLKYYEWLVIENPDDSEVTNSQTRPILIPYIEDFQIHKEVDVRNLAVKEGKLLDSEGNQVFLITGPYLKWVQEYYESASLEWYRIMRSFNKSLSDPNQ